MEGLLMAKKRTKHKNDSRLAKESRKAIERRAAIWSYLIIAIVLGLILYGLYLQTLHHN
jgi:type VI protein secretion system component VasF